MAATANFHHSKNINIAAELKEKSEVLKDCEYLLSKEFDFEVLEIKVYTMEEIGMLNSQLYSK